MEQAKVIAGWSGRHKSGTSIITLSAAVTAAGLLPDKRVLWMTTDAFFCPADRALALKREKLQKSIDFLIDHMSAELLDEINGKLINKALMQLDGVQNLHILLESSTKDRDYIRQNKEKFTNVIMPTLSKRFDVIVIDTAGQLSSEITKQILRNADGVLHLLAQDSVALDTYLKYRDELDRLVDNRINLLNGVRDIQPDIKAIRTDYERQILIIHDDPEFASAANTGNLISYLRRETALSKEISIVTRVLLEAVGVPVSEEKNEHIAERKRGLMGFLKKGVKRREQKN